MNSKNINIICNISYDLLLKTFVEYKKNTYNDDDKSNNFNSDILSEQTEYTLKDIYNIYPEITIGNFVNYFTNLIKGDINIFANYQNIINKYKMLIRLTTNKCLKCEYNSNYLGYCIGHYNQTDFINDINNFEHELKNNKKEIINTITNITNIVSYIKQILYITEQLYYATLFKHNNIQCMFSYKKCYIHPPFYNKVNTIFKNDIIIDIIKHFNDNADYNNIHNIFSLLAFLKKQYNFNMQYLFDLRNNIRYNGEYKNNHIKKIYIGNNDILYQHIINSKINKYIEYITPEYSIYNINNNNHLRFDLYIILNIDNNYFELCIETDEKYHRSQFNKNDMIKDNILIDSNISFIRIDIEKKITDKEINFVLFCIEYLIKTKSPIYYFSDKYIENINKYFTDDTIDNLEISFGSAFNENKMLNNIKNINDFNKSNLDKYIKNMNIQKLIDKHNKLINHK